ncbi:MAG: hypothetical protein M1816_006134 [Peltula sp. TS41687]|nr:MAG: hypothetical protein M1816_006134 [Peltula sp. TS41687]
MLVAVTALPSRARQPQWESPKTRYSLNPVEWWPYYSRPVGWNDWRREDPSYPPPDLGPRNLDTEFFDDFPGLSKNRGIDLKRIYKEKYDENIRSIANDYPKTPPTPEQLRAIQRNIHQEMAKCIKDAQYKTARYTKRPAPKEPTAEDVEAALGKLEGRIREALGIGIAEQQAARPPPKPASRDMPTILQELQDEAQELEKLSELGCKAQVERRRAQETLDYCAQEYQRRGAKIQELLKEFHGLSRVPAAGEGEEENHKAGPGPKTNKSDFSMRSVEDRVKSFTRAVGGFIQDVSNRVDANTGERQGGGNPHVISRPFGTLARPMLPGGALKL